MSTPSLPEAYILLGLRPPLEFEAEALKATPGIVRRIGTTTQMLVNAALDVCDGSSVLLRFATRNEANTARAATMGFVMKLGGSFEQLNNLAANTSMRPVTDPTQYTAIYTDHMRDPMDGVDLRVLGPFGSALYAVPVVDGRFEVFDRDGMLLGLVTQDGVSALRERHFIDVMG